MYTGPEIVLTVKGEYAKRKQTAVALTAWALDNSVANGAQWKTFFDSLPAKADVSDAFLYSFNHLYDGVRGLRNSSGLAPQQTKKSKAPRTTRKPYKKAKRAMATTDSATSCAKLQQ